MEMPQLFAGAQSDKSRAAHSSHRSALLLMTHF